MADAKDVGEGVFGAAHVVGGGLLNAFGLGAVTGAVEEAGGDHLPGWAQRDGGKEMPKPPSNSKDARSDASKDHKERDAVPSHGPDSESDNTILIVIAVIALAWGMSK